MKQPEILERHRVSGPALVAKVRELVHQGNTRRITLLNDEGETLMEIPLTLGVVGAVLLPIWVALGAIAALAANYRLIVEKVPHVERRAAPVAEVPAEPAMAAPADIEC